MSTEIIPLNGMQMRGHDNCKPAKSSPCPIEISAAVSQRIADAAIWEGRTVTEFVLAMLNAAFPDQTGGA